METVPNPAARAARSALDLFGAVTQQQAGVLLSMWCRRDELTDADVEAVIASYPGRLADVDTLDDRHATPAGGPLPAHVDGYPVKGRDRRTAPCRTRAGARAATCAPAAAPTAAG